MKLYRGDWNNEFQVKEWIRSRYGFQALFFTTDLALARLYAIHAAQERRMPGAGAVYEAEVNDLWVFKYDFQGKSAYHGPEFRNMIHTFKQFNHKAVQVYNVVDYPNKSMMRLEYTDVVVVFDYKIIENLRCIDSKIWQP